MPTTQSQVEYVANTRIGEKGQLTIPKQYRVDILPGLKAGDSYRAAHSASPRRVPVAGGITAPLAWQARRA
jgi:hypothetical protein